MNKKNNHFTYVPVHRLLQHFALGLKEHNSQQILALFLPPYGALPFASL